MPTKTGSQKSVSQLKAELLAHGEGEDYSIQTRGTKSSDGPCLCRKGKMFILLVIVGLIIFAVLTTVVVEAATKTGMFAKDTCVVQACSESQGNSANDAGTNMCNMQNLFCDESTANADKDPEVACTPITKNLAYNIDYLECGRYKGNGEYYEHDCQQFNTTCLLQPSEEDNSVTGVLRRLLEDSSTLEEVTELGGAPKDYDHDAFMKFNSCPGSGATQHTMAQMSMKFENSCGEVSKEILARANGEESWLDPHNRGVYTVVQDADPIIIKRRTGNDKYTDKMTFSLTKG